eukprot:EG_transcript_37222
MNSISTAPLCRVQVRGCEVKCATTVKDGVRRVEGAARCSSVGALAWCRVRRSVPFQKKICPKVEHLRRGRSHCGRRRSLLVDVRLAAAPHAVPNAAPAAMGVLPDLLEHRRVLQHVRQDHEPDLAPTQENLLQGRCLPISMCQRQVVNLAVHVVLCLRQEAAICLARQGL